MRSLIMTEEQIKKDIHYHERIIENHQKELSKLRGDLELLKLKQKLNEKESH